MADEISPKRDDKDEKQVVGGSLPVPESAPTSSGAPPVPSGAPATPSGSPQGLPEKMPDIPSFRPGAAEAEKKGAGLLGRGAPGNAAMKLRGLANSSSLMDRLKQLRKKDLIFIASGLSVLMMAPLAEHFVLGPGEDSNVLKQGFDSKGGPFVEANPYETGTGMATGNLPGQSSDVITPLNVRDPMSLIFGAGAQQAGTTGAGAGTGAGSGSASSSKEGWKDAISEASRAGARTAIDTGGLPMSKGTLSGSLRGLSALSGSSYGGGPTFNLGPVNAAVGGRGGGSNMAPVTAAAGYKGPAGRSLSSASSIEALKKAADNAGSLLNRPGSASDNLTAAAREAIPTGGASDGMGGPGKGQDGKNPGGNSSKDTRTVGESLAFLRAKMEMEKAVDLKWKEIEWNTFGRQKMIQEEMIKTGFEILKKGVAEPFEKAIAKELKGALGTNPAEFNCCNQTVDQDDIDACTKGTKEKGETDCSQLLLACIQAHQGDVTSACTPVGGSANPSAAQHPGGSHDAQHANECTGSAADCGRQQDTENQELTKKNLEDADKNQACLANADCKRCLDTSKDVLKQTQDPLSTRLTGITTEFSSAKTSLIRAAVELKTAGGQMQQARTSLSQLIAAGAEACNDVNSGDVNGAQKVLQEKAKPAYDSAVNAAGQCPKSMEQANTNKQAADGSLRQAYNDIQTNTGDLRSLQTSNNMITPTTDGGSGTCQASSDQIGQLMGNARTRYGQIQDLTATAQTRYDGSTGASPVLGYAPVSADVENMKSQIGSDCTSLNQLLRNNGNSYNLANLQLTGPGVAPTAVCDNTTLADREVGDRTDLAKRIKDYANQADALQQQEVGKLDESSLRASFQVKP